MTHDAPTTTARPAQPRFSVEWWAALWANPHPELAGRVVTPDVVGHWPGDPGAVRGVGQYKRRVAGLLAEVPGLRLEVAEHAGNGDVLFIGWIGRGAGANGPFEFRGVDQILLRDGLIREHRIFYDPILLEQAVRAAPSGATTRADTRATPCGSSHTFSPPGAAGAVDSGPRRHSSQPVHDTDA